MHQNEPPGHALPGASARSLAESTDSPMRRRFVVFTLIPDEYVQTLLSRLAQAPLTGREVTRLRNYRVACWIRELGWLAGGVAILAIPVGLLSILGAFNLRFAAGAMVGVATTSLSVFMWASLAWLCAYVGVGTMNPSTSFAFRLDYYLRYATLSPDVISRTDVNFAISASGALARVLFRSVTKRFMNAGIRPDLALQVTDLCRYLLITLPAGGPDALRRDGESLSVYGRFARDAGALLVVQRVDLIPAAAGLYPQLSVVDLDDDLEKFVHPLAKRSLIEATAEFVLPAIAAVLSVVALVVSIVK